MRIPNKFNGYMSDGRRLYPDPATSAIMAEALAGSAGTAAAASVPVGAELATAAGASAIPGIVGGAAPALSAAAPAAQGIAAGTQAMAPEIAANAAQAQAVNAGQNFGLQQMAGNPAVNPAETSLNTSLNSATGTGQGFKIPADTFSKTVEYDPHISQGLTNSGGIEAGEANLQADASQLATKSAPSPFQKGDAAAQFSKDVSKFSSDHPLITTGGIMLAQNLMQPSSGGSEKKSYKGSSSGGSGGGNFTYNEPSTQRYTPIFQPTPYAVGGPVEQMSAQNAVGSNTMYPQSQLQTSMYSNPMVQRPMPNNVISSGIDTPTDTYTGESHMAEGGKVSAFEKLMREEKARQKAQQEAAQAQIDKGKSMNASSKPYSRTQSTNTPYAAAVKEFQALNKKYGIQTAAPAKTNVDLMGDQDQMEYAAKGGIMHGLGGYSDGGRLLKGPGDGVSDSIPAVIGRKQPARLADGEFVIPARIVSELGNGSTEAGARKLYAMMERVQKQRGKTIGKGKVAVNSKADKHLPA